MVATIFVSTNWPWSNYKLRIRLRKWELMTAIAIRLLKHRYFFYFMLSAVLHPVSCKALHSFLWTNVYLFHKKHGIGNEKFAGLMWLTATCREIWRANYKPTGIPGIQKTQPTQSKIDQNKDKGSGVAKFCEREQSRTKQKRKENR